MTWLFNQANKSVATLTRASSHLWEYEWTSSIDKWQSHWPWEERFWCGGAAEYQQCLHLPCPLLNPELKTSMWHNPTRQLSSSTRVLLDKVENELTYSHRQQWYLLSRRKIGLNWSIVFWEGNPQLLYTAWCHSVWKVWCSQSVRPSSERHHWWQQHHGCAASAREKFKSSARHES